MREAPLVSVVIPTYNRQETLPAAIDSALNQTYENIEVIVVDDSSTDNTEELVQERYSEAVCFLQHEENQGGSAARNTGIEHSQGQYIAFLDSDDEWHPNKVERQVERIESLSEEWVGVYCDFHQTRSSRVVELFDNLFPRASGFEGGDELLEYVLTKRFAHGGSSALLIDSDAIDEIGGFDEKFQRHQDIEFLVRLLQIGKLAYVDEELFYKNDTGLPDFEDVINSDRKFRNKFEDVIEEQERQGNDITGVHNYRLSKCYFRHRKYKEGTKRLYNSTFPENRDRAAVVIAFLQGLVKQRS